MCICAQWSDFSCGGGTGMCRFGEFQSGSGRTDGSRFSGHLLPVFAVSAREELDYFDFYAAVNETVNLARKLARGREGFINGVLRGYIKRKNEDFLPDRETDSVHDGS